MDLDTCLRCGDALEGGSVVGQNLYLNWESTDEPRGRTMHGKQHLATGSVSRGPRLPGAICRSCGLGYFDGSAATA